MAKHIADMTMQELETELTAIEQHINWNSQGMGELEYREALYNEANSRGYEITIKKIVRLKEINKEQ